MFRWLLLVFPAGLAAAAAKPDPEIRACIEAGLKRSPTLSEESFSVAVANSVATFSGTAKKHGSKGGVYAIASSCGATKVINNIASGIPKAADSKKK